MGRRRMFSLDVVDTDKFHELPFRTQALYFHLGMKTDDDGFVTSPKSIAKAVRATAADLRLLEDEGLIITFPSGVCVISDWGTNNQIRADRYHQTKFYEERSQLELISGRYFRLNS